LAWINYRHGRGDRRGAFRLALFFALHTLITFMLTARHAPIFPERENFYRAMSWALFSGLTTWGYYMALEPFIRRRLPETLISWNRLLAGQFRDPKIGRDILVSLLTAASILTLLSLVAIVYSGPLGRIQTQYLLGGRNSVIGVFNMSGTAFSFCVMILLLYFLFLLVLRKQWIATLCFAVLMVAVFGAIIPESSLWMRMGATLFPLTAALLLVRLGLVAGCFFGFTVGMLMCYPLTFNFSAWYASGGLFAMAVLLALAIYAFYTSLGGQKVFTGKLLEE
jgi:serine/threonine-protein kinase